MKKLVRYATAAAAALILVGCAGGTTSTQMVTSNNELERVIIGIVQGGLFPFALIGRWINYWFPGIIPGDTPMLEASIGTDPFYATGFLAGFMFFWAAVWLARVRLSAKSH